MASSPGLRTWNREASRHGPVVDVHAASRYFAAQGFEPKEVGNLTALLYGLAPVECGWTVDEIERLLFVRHLVERQLIRS